MIDMLAFAVMWEWLARAHHEGEQGAFGAAQQNRPGADHPWLHRLRGDLAEGAECVALQRRNLTRVRVL